MIQLTEVEEEDNVETFNDELKEAENELIALREITGMMHLLIGSSGSALNNCERSSRQALQKLVSGADILKRAYTVYGDSTATSIAVVLIPVTIGAAAGGPLGAVIGLNAASIIGGVLTGGAVGAAGGLYLRSKLS